MSVAALERQISEAIRGAVTLEQRGINDFRVETPFCTLDGDELKIILSRLDNGQWKLSDEGHTLMYLSYYDFNLNAPAYKKDLEKIVRTHGLEEKEGRIVLNGLETDSIGYAVFSFIQGLNAVADIALRRPKCSTQPATQK